MTPQEIAARLTAIHTALVEKIGEQPFLAPDLTVSQGGKCRIDINKAYGKGSDDCYLGTAKGDTFEETLAAADAFISALPNPHETAKRGWQKKLGAVIDEGHALNLPTDVMAPLGAASQAMTKNLIVKEAVK
ncbi:MAG: hypothetical protein PF443_09255 [Allgaiera sp.]|jgi:hypothetical protein|nr:hypothetical protein [Allgaiera sp.]